MKRFLLLSFGLHMLLIGALALSEGLFLTSRSYPPVYQINLVAAPAEAMARAEPARAEPREKRPPEPPKKTEEKIPEPEEKKVREPEVEKPPESPQPRKEAETREARGVESEVPLTLEGKPFPHQYYLENMVAKVQRNWTPTSQPLKAVVYFQIRRNGSIQNVRIEEESGSYLFDRAAQRAILQSSPFPPLPDGYAGDHLGVYFEFNTKEKE